MRPLQAAEELGGGGDGGGGRVRSGVNVGRKPKSRSEYFRTGVRTKLMFFLYLFIT